MRTFAIIVIVVGLLMLGVAQQAQQPTNSATNNQSPSGGTPPPQYPAPQRPGTLKAQGQPLTFFARGEGTLTIQGRGYLLINDPTGKLNIQVAGFQQMKELPRNVRLKAPMDQRIRIYQGQGTLTVKGKFDSVRAVLRQGSLDFKGIGAFNLGGQGKAFLDGVERQLFPTGTFTLLVPEPDWQKQDDVKPAPNPRQ
ncbi:MAG: hypothetical protein SNJ72_02505 [Fimbriimonadales bacterium]